MWPVPLERQVWRRRLEMSENFELWWREHGNGLRATHGHDSEEHTRNVAALVWSAATAFEKERCARVAEGVERTEERHWVKGSLYDTLRRETAAEIRR